MPHWNIEFWEMGPWGGEKQREGTQRTSEVIGDGVHLGGQVVSEGSPGLSECGAGEHAGLPRKAEG